MLLSVFLGIMLVIAGILAVQFHKQIYNFTGALAFVERRVTAGTQSFIKLFGVFLVLIGIGLTFGLFDWLGTLLGEAVRSMFQVKT